MVLPGHTNARHVFNKVFGSERPKTAVMSAFNVTHVSVVVAEVQSCFRLVSQECGSLTLLK